MDPNLSKILQDAKSWAIIIPDNPTFDEVAAALTLQLGFSDTKNISVYSTQAMRVEFNRLVGVDKIQNTIGNKNLVLSFPGYDAKNIERVSYDIDDKQNLLTLTVIPNPDKTAPSQDQIKVEYSGLDAEVVLLIGGDSEKDFSILGNSEMNKLQKIHFGVISLKDLLRQDVQVALGNFPSVSEYVYNFLLENQKQMTIDIANNLVAGIDMATNFLAVPSLTPQTFSTFSTLLQTGATRHIPEQIANPQKAMQQMQQMGQMGQGMGMGQMGQSFGTQQFGQPMGSYQPAIQTTQPIDSQTQTQPAPQTQPMTQPIGNTQQPQPIPQQQAPVNPVAPNIPESEKKEGADKEGNVPKDWTGPKLYKGTSVN